MAKIPKGAKVTFDTAPQKIPAGAKVTYEGPTPEEAATMPAPEPSRTERVLAYLKGTPGRIADTATSASTIPSAMTGATMGALPYMSAAIDTAPAAARKLIGAESGSIGEEFDRNLRKVKPLYDTAVEKEPVANFVGMAASPNPLGKSGAAGRVVGAAGAGALQQYLGTDGPRALDAGSDASVVAGGLQAGAELLPSALRPIAKGLRSAAGEKAVQAVGARAGITDRLAKMGITPDDVPELGNKFLDEGLVPSGLNPFASPLKQTSNAAGALKASSGGKIGAAIKAADASGADFVPAEAQAAMRAKMGITNPLMDDNATKANKLIEQVGGLSPQGEYAAANSFAEANRMKSQAWEGADFRADTKLAPKLYKQANAGLRDDIQRQVGAATSPEVEASLVGANRQYSTASKAQTLADMADSRDVQRQQFGTTRALIGAMAGGGAGAFGGPTSGTLGAGLGIVASKALSARGPNVAAHAYRAGSKGAATLAEQTLPPNASAATGSALADYLQPMDDEERQRRGIAHFTGQ